MPSFKNDYSEGCHPLILEKLARTNVEQLAGYGEDVYCKHARKVIQGHISDDQADIYFVSGGTQANAIIISSMLRPFESVISANTGHINVHEAGAIEATGHKVESVTSVDGKLTPDHIQSVLDLFEDHHMVKPRMVYISNSTEVGTVYTKAELKALYAFCTTHNLYLFLDGARLGSAIAGSDLSLSDVAQYTDVFYIGGTKNGALCGEAIVIVNDLLKPDFLFCIKQRGGLLAKGRLLGIQFLTLFEGTLFFDLAEHTNSMARKLSVGITDSGYAFLSNSTSNQIFPILPNDHIEQLLSEYDFYVWKKIDKENSAIRLVTSWATKQENVDGFLSALKKLS